MSWNPRFRGLPNKRFLSFNILHVERELEECCRQENKNRLGGWREKVKTDRNAFRWLRRQVTNLTHAIKLGRADEPSASVREVLGKLKQYWEQIWNRPSINEDEAWRHISSCMPEPVAPARWADLTADELIKYLPKHGFCCWH